ncbi:MAG: hypothetical protein AB7F89_06060, partial [Pirellulaceae bacterium]
MSRPMLAGWRLCALLMCVSGGLGIRAQAPADPVPDSVYVGTPHDVVAKMLEVAQVVKQDVGDDLGCGEGRS